MQARDLMTKEVVTIGPKTTVMEAARFLRERGVSGLPVVDENRRILGIVTERDVLLKRIAPTEPDMVDLFFSLFNEKEAKRYANDVRKMFAATAEEIMTKPVISVEAGEDAIKVGQIILDRGIKRVPVTEFGKLVGIISRHDLLRLVTEG
ncbi:MAG: CBS domain-containing protein [Schwartzia sp.]|nr:CBS domain-containing protein [Schwartzia sp. (in: firmicutes)]